MNHPETEIYFPSWKTSMGITWNNAKEQPNQEL